MREQNQYSDEHISAYIDGELDNEERARLLFDEQRDTELAQRISDTRTLKEKMLLAYSEVSPHATTKKPLSCAEFVSSRRALVASIGALIITAALLMPAIMNNNDITVARKLIRNTEVISSDKIITAVGDSKQVIINLSQYQPDTFDTTINHIDKLLLQHSDDPLFNIEIVANRDGLKALDTKTSRHAKRISLLTKQYKSLNVVACVKSMADLADSGNPIKLMKDIILTPSAAEQVAKRMSDGWMFLKL